MSRSKGLRPTSPAATLVAKSEPADLTALVVAAFGPAAVATRTAEEREAAICKLMGPLWGFAWRVTPDHDLAEELRAHVLFRLQEGRYDPDLGSFASWCRTVMTRRLITLVNSRDRATGGDDSPEAADPRGHSSAGDDARTAPFSAEDRIRIARWTSPLKRVLLLAHGLLWQKLPASDWSADLAALGLPDPFPCAEFEDMIRAERNAYLAESLGVPRNTIHVRLARWQRYLLDLKFVRDLAARER